MLSSVKNLKSFKIIIIPVRYKHPPFHWSVLKKKKTACQKALDHFDNMYANIYQDSWEVIRRSLLAKNHRYIAIVNNYSDSKRICEELECLGAINMKRIYEVNEKLSEPKEKFNVEEHTNINVDTLNKATDVIQTEKEIKHSQNSYQSDKDLIDKELNKNDAFEPFELQSIEKDVTTISNNNRIIRSSLGLPASQLHEYIPATKIMGKDNFILESEQYSFYTEGSNFFAQIEEEDFFNFPSQLSIYTFESGNDTMFPKPKIGSIGLTDYFMVDSASILPVLSLDLQPEDKYLDMCAGPGAKTLIALQYWKLRLTVINDIEKSRIKRVQRFIDQFIPKIQEWNQQFILTTRDARYIEEKNLYNKILVDVPCTTDRHVLHEDDNNIFKGSRVQERLMLPHVQSEILINALKLVTCGGTVVYSTCTLSPIQNDGVVQVALKRVFEEDNIVFVVKDQIRALNPLKYIYSFGDCGLRYGHIVIPTRNKNCGPMYFCKMVRIQ